MPLHGPLSEWTLPVISSHPLAPLAPCTETLQEEKKKRPRGRFAMLVVDKINWFVTAESVHFYSNPLSPPFLFCIHFLPSAQRAFVSISALDLLHFPNFPNFSQLLFQLVIKASGTLHYAVVHLGPVVLHTLVIHADLFFLLKYGRGLMKTNSQILNTYNKLWSIMHFALPCFALCAYF